MPDSDAYKEIIAAVDAQTEGLSNTEYREVLEEVVSDLESRLTAVREELADEPDEASAVDEEYSRESISIEDVMSEEGE